MGIKLDSFSNKQKEALYTELNVLMEAGLTLKDALSLLLEEQKQEKSRVLFQQNPRSKNSEKRKNPRFNTLTRRRLCRGVRINNRSMGRKPRTAIVFRLV